MIVIGPLLTCFLVETAVYLCQPFALIDCREFVAASFKVSNTTLDEMCSTNRDCKCRLSHLSVPPSLPAHKTDAPCRCLTPSAKVDENALKYGKGTYGFLQEPLGSNLFRHRPFTSAPALSWYEAPGKVPL